MEAGSRRCGAGLSVMVGWVAMVRNEVRRFSRGHEMVGREGVRL